jgi:hypothetical protein
MLTSSSLLGQLGEKNHSRITLIMAGNRALNSKNSHIHHSQETVNQINANFDP